jgi:hypothetical protein
MSYFKEKYSVTGPAIKMTNKHKTLKIMIMENRKTPNVTESVCNVPEDAGVNFFCFSSPTIIKPPIIGIKRPDNMAKAVVRFQKGVLLPKPPKFDPLPATDEINS